MQRSLRRGAFGEHYGASTQPAVDNYASLCGTGGADVLSRGELGLGIPRQGLSYFIRKLSTIEHGG